MGRQNLPTTPPGPIHAVRQYLRDHWKDILLTLAALAIIRLAVRLYWKW